jgi:B9 domain-containing protein 1
VCICPGITAFGNDVIRGYGCTHVPLTPGRHVRYLHLYSPVSSSLWQRFTSWVTNNPPEFFDSKFIAQGKGREVTRVKSQGTVKITFNVISKNMAEWSENSAKLGPT